MTAIHPADAYSLGLLDFMCDVADCGETTRHEARDQPTKWCFMASKPPRAWCPKHVHLMQDAHVTAFALGVAVEQTQTKATKELFS